MSQNIFTNIDPFNTNGEELAVFLNQFRDAVLSGFSGPVRPALLGEGGYWIDTSQSASPDYLWSMKLWTGTLDIVLFNIKINSGEISIPGTSNTFNVVRVSNDAVGPEVYFEKGRLSGGGQVKDGDVIGTWTFNSTDDTSTKHLSARVDVIAVGDVTGTNWGSKISIKTVENNGAGGTTISEKILIDGHVYVKTRLQADAFKLTAQDIASSANIDGLDTSKAIVRITGSTETNIRGIISTGLTKILTIHNVTDTKVNLIPESIDVTTEENRLSLPDEVSIDPLMSVELFYDEAATRWKLKSGSGTGSGSGGGSGSRLNLIADPSFEKGVDEISLSGAGTVDQDSTEVLATPTNLFCAKLDLSASNESSIQKNLDEVYDGVVAVFTGMIKTTEDLTAFINSSELLVTGDGTWKRFYIEGTFSAPAPDTANVAGFKNTPAAVYYLDEVYFGPKDGAPVSSSTGGGSGDYLIVADEDERNAIPSFSRKYGLRVFQQDTSQEWQLGVGLSNLDWNIVPKGAGFSKIITMNSSGTVDPGVDCVLVDATDAPVNVTLPTLDSNQVGNQLVTIIKIDSSENLVKALAGSGTTIQGSASEEIPYRWNKYKFQTLTTTLWGKFNE